MPRAAVRYLPLCVAAVMLWPALSRAQDAAPTRIAIADPVRIFNDMQEKKDLKDKMEQEGAALAAVDKDKRTKVEDLKSARDQLNPTSGQYAEREKEYLNARIDYQVWGQQQTAEAQRQQKLQLKKLYEKIQAATAKVAQKRGFDLVLAASLPPFPENLDEADPNQVRAIINQRNILYAHPRVDISPDVIAQLDADYKSGAPSSPAPAPAPSR
jgi:Skp family chaperone for outer membrane proteins